MKDFEEYERLTQDVLTSIGKFIDKYAAFQNQECRDAVVLWAAHVWVYRKFEATPRLSMYSSEPGSGKSRVMDLMTDLAPKSVDAVNARPSMVYNMIEESDNLVFAIDEVDKLYGRRGSNNAGKQLTAILNKGFYTDATTPSGSPGNYREVGTSCPVVMAGMGDIPDDLNSRSIRIPMRSTSAELEDYRRRKVAIESGKLKAKLEHWAREVGEVLEFMFPEVPMKNRQADKWQPLFTIAELAGKEWTLKVNRAARLLESNDASSTVPLSTRLIRDVETIVVERDLSDKDKIHTETLIESLVEMGWNSRMASPKAIAKTFGDHDVLPTTVKVGSKIAKGYKVSDLNIAFDAV